MSDPILYPIPGSDGIVPVYDPFARWCWWNYNEIFFGQGTPGAGELSGTSRYVPKLRDFVVDDDLKVTYKVTDIDPTTLVPHLTEFTFAGVSTNLTEEDILTGVGPGTQSDTYRVYLDTSVTPYILAVDARLKVAGTMCSYCKIFLGADVGSGGKVISYLFDPSGNVLTQNIPLELVEMENPAINYAVKTVPVCYTNEMFPDGQLVTAVFFSAEGNVVSRRQLLIDNTSWIRTVASDQKYISGISLESPFLSTQNDHLIEYPINIPVDAMNMFGIVHYSDGSTLRLPVDGTKFRMLGMEQYLSSVIGQTVNLILSYRVDPSEMAVGGVSSDGMYVTEPYSLTTTQQNGAYTVKLFCYPQWVDAANGYTLRWFLYNLDRNTHYEVTSLISFANNSAAFNPTAYGVQQNLIPRVNLKDISQMYASYIHVQPMYVVLRAQGTERITNWTVNSTPGDSIDYGVDVHCRTTTISSTAWGLKVDSDFPDQATWLQNLYTRSKPLTDPKREFAAPLPNMFIIQVGSQSYEYTLDNWNQQLVLPVQIPLNSTLVLRWIKRTSTGDLDLGVAGLPVYAYTLSP